MEKSADTLSERIRQMPQNREIRSEELPNIDLYIDQVITLMAAGLAPEYCGNKNKALTRTMVNNYSKEGLLKQIRGKKYSKEHILIMELIRGLKQTLPIRDIKSLLQVVDERISADKHSYIPGSVEELYDASLQIRGWERERFLELTAAFEREFDISLECRADLLYSVLFFSGLAGMAADAAQWLIESARNTSTEEQ